MQKLRRGGVAAVAGIATLVTPLLTIQSAQAAGTIDLSVTKSVTSLAPPVTYIPELADVRNGGSATFGDAGITIRSTGTADKVANYWAQSGPIPSSASMSWTQSEGSFMPGMQILFDTDGVLGNGTGDWNILVNVPSDNGDNWWLTPSSSDIAKAAAPSCQPSCTPGVVVNGYPWFGTLSDWVTALGSSAQVYAVGYSLGSGASGVNSGILASMTYGSHQYDFTRHYSSSLKAAPGDTVKYKINVANSLAAGATATGITLSDVLPSDLTYVPNSLQDSGWCDFTGNTLSCANGILPVGSSANVYFEAVVSDSVSSAGLGSTIGHNVDVQKQEVFADLPAGQTRTYSVTCPAGYLPTDGGLLLDAVDQGGYYSDIVVSKSQPTAGGWVVRASNLGEERGQGKVKVTCLDGTVGSADGHTHDIVVDGSTTSGTIAASSANDLGETVTASCPTGYTPVAPGYTVTSGIATVRASYASGDLWVWVVDHEVGTAATFDVDCLAPETTSTKDHTASLTLSTQNDTITVGADSRDEGIEQCGSNANAIVGGYAGEDAELLSLGKEARGNNYMFRFYNDDWDNDWDAAIQVECVGVRTPDEPKYYRITNTATVSAVESDLSGADNSSSATVLIVGDGVQPGAAVVVGPNGSRTGSAGHIKKVNLSITCAAACAFTVKVVKDGHVVAKATKSYAGSPNPRLVAVPTTRAGKDLAHHDEVTVKVKTSAGLSTTAVTLS